MPPGISPVYQKLLDFRNYWRTLDPTLFEPVRRDLEVTIASDPNFAAAYACFSMLYPNAARYGIDVSKVSDAPLVRALGLARTAIHLAPNSSRLYRAREGRYEMALQARRPASPWSISPPPRLWPGPAGRTRPGHG